jgi:hypothetical protein
MPSRSARSVWSRVMLKVVRWEIKTRIMSGTSEHGCLASLTGSLLNQYICSGSRLVRAMPNRSSDSSPLISSGRAMYR